MVGIIVFLAIVVFIICAAINDKKKQEEAAQKEARKKAQEEQEKRKLEQQTAQKIQAAISRVEQSDFYKKLIVDLREYIQKDMQIYLKKTYREYIKTPGTIPSQFASFSDIEKNLSIILGDIEIMPSGIHYAHHTGVFLLQSDPSDGLCDIQVDFAKNGYSNMDPFQTWALAQKMSDDLGYRVTSYYVPNGTDDRSCENTRMDVIAIRYLKMVQEYSQTTYSRGWTSPVHIRINPYFVTDYLKQYILSEIRLLQNSSVSYKSPF